MLHELDDPGWETASLCAGWRIRDVALRLLMPYERSVPRFFARMAAAAGFKFDAMADRWATTDRRASAHILTALRETAHGRFRVPGAPPEGPLSHLVVHAEDVYRPLGIDHDAAPRTSAIVLDQLTSRRGRRSLTGGLLDGLSFTATDTECSYGTGPEALSPARALITTLAGRPAAIDELTGSGAAELRRAHRLHPASGGPLRRHLHVKPSHGPHGQLSILTVAVAVAH